MKILYDFQGFIQPCGGISRYFTEIIKELRDSNEIEIACPFSKNIYLRDTLGMSPLSFNRGIRLQLLFNEMYCKYKVSRNDYDIFHATFDTNFYYKNIIKKPYVLTFHDLIPEKFMQNSPNWQQMLPIRKEVLRNASRIMCVSQYTRKTLLEYYPFIDPSKTDCIYHGVYPYTKLYKKNKIGDYILYVGGRKGYKNYQFTIAALKPLFFKYKELKFICTGLPFTKEEKKQIYDLGLDGRVINMPYVDDDTLASLYHHAKLFIFPSKYEGFGIPILESFTNGCPACISNATCFPEVGADAVSYFNPNSEEEIRQSVEKLLTDTEYADLLREKGFERVKHFTWKNAANQVLLSYNKVIK